MGLNAAVRSQGFSTLKRKSKRASCCRRRYWGRERGSRRKLSLQRTNRIVLLLQHAVPTSGSNWPEQTLQKWPSFSLSLLPRRTLFTARVVGFSLRTLRCCWGNLELIFKPNEKVRCMEKSIPSWIASPCEKSKSGTERWGGATSGYSFVAVIACRKYLGEHQTEGQRDGPEIDAGRSFLFH